MQLTAQQVMALTEESLRKFLALSIPEGLYLDYKESLSGTSEKETKREFLKDVTAFANAAGGHLFLGVKEPSEGLLVERQLVGLENGDALAQDLERLASSSIDPAYLAYGSSAFHLGTVGRAWSFISRPVSAAPTWSTTRATACSMFATPSLASP
jgi:hypothetical protein